MVKAHRRPGFALAMQQGALCAPPGLIVRLPGRDVKEKVLVPEPPVYDPWRRRRWIRMIGSTDPLRTSL